MDKLQKGLLLRRYASLYSFRASLEQFQGKYFTRWHYGDVLDDVKPSLLTAHDELANKVKVLQLAHREMHSRAQIFTRVAKKNRRISLIIRFVPTCLW